MHPDFATILNWRLLAGSHPFPGPDGGTCINEAAIVAAGLPYRAIRSSADCPPCFSRPAAAYALGLNDAMPDEARPQLMAFVLRLSGSADTPEIEAARTRRLALESGLIDQIGGEPEAIAWLESREPGLGDLPVRDWEVERQEPFVARILGRMAASGGILGEISLRTGPKLYSIGP